jgi:hypothetical protein
LYDGVRFGVRRLAFAAAALLVGRAALAQEEAIVLRYDPGPGCPSEARFLSDVAAYTPKLKLAPAGSIGRTFTVTTTPAEGSISGQLVIEEEGARAVREVKGRSCAEVVSALALATALAVDPSALGDEPIAAPPTPAPAPPAPESAPPPPAPSSSPWLRGLAIAFSARAMTGLGETTMFGGAVTAEGEIAGAPALRLGPSFVESRSADLRVRIVSGTLALCPRLGELGASVGIRTCVGVEIGALEATGQGAAFVPTPSQHGLITHAEAALALRWTFAAPLFVEIAAGAEAHLSRYTFRLHGNGDPAVYDQRPFGGSASVGVGVLVF